MTEATPIDHADAAAQLGAILRRARERRDLSVGDVSERLKFPARQVDALEKGDYSKLAEPVFVKGFISSYARFLDVDETLVREYTQAIFPSAQVSHQAVEPFAQSKTRLDYRDTPLRKPLPKWIFAVIVLATLGGVIYAWQNKSSLENDRQNEAASQVNDGQAGAFSVQADNITILPMDSSSAVSATPAMAAAASAPAAIAASAAVDAQTMVINVRYRSLLHVVNAQGEVLKSEIVPARSEQRFEGGAPYQVKIGYATGTTISLGGVAVPLSQAQMDGKTATLTVGAVNE